MPSKNYIKYIFLSVFLLTSFLSAKTQDIHFSQFLNSPLNLNPAETGLFTGDLRIVANHKRQWKSFENAYNTLSASIDKTFFENKKLKPSLGFLINNDIAGDGDFGTLNLALPFSLKYNYNKSLFSLGISFSYIQHNINFNALYFGNQYNGDQFDPDLPNSEIPNTDRFSYLDLSSGILFTHQFTDSIKLHIGISIDHLLSPIKSFYENTNIQLSPSLQMYSYVEFPISTTIFAQPCIMFRKQETYTEFDIGSMFRFDFNPLGLKSIFLGGYMRTQDAGILIFGMDYNNMLFQLSYDINISKLYTISRGRGGIELSMIYILNQPKIYINNPVRKCPDFM